MDAKEAEKWGASVPAAESMRRSVIEGYGRKLDELRAKSAAKEEWTDASAPEPPPNAADAVAFKETGMARAASKAQGLVQAAQSVARKLGANGAVTIDDVIHEMKRLGYDESKVGTGEKDAPKNWKGSVFASGEWVCTGSIASREKTAHGRQVRQWCLKSWLRSHPVNGSDNSASAFSLFRMYEEARHWYTHGEKLAFHIGMNMLDGKFSGLMSVTGRTRYDKSGRKLSESSKTLYGLDVYLFDGVGAYVAEEPAEK